MTTETGRDSATAPAGNRHHKRAVQVFAALIALSLLALAAFVALGGKDALLTMLARLETETAARPAMALAIYALVCLVTQMIVVPSGTVLALAGGYLLGMFPAGGILTGAGLISSVVVYHLAREALSGNVAAYAARTPERTKALDALRAEGAAAVATLRLAPIVPNAVAATLSAGAGIGFATFMTASAVTIWVRPFAVASLGASLRQLSDAARGVPASFTVAMAGLFAAALLILAARLFARAK